MEKNQPITITQNANGFSVTPTCDMHGGYMITSVHVFNSMADLTTWLTKHFSHRAANVTPDLSTDAELARTRFLAAP